MQRVLLLIATLAVFLPFAAFQQSSGHSVDSEPQLIEAEDGELTDNSVLTERPDYSGAGYVGTFESDGSSVAVDVDVDNTGPYDVVIIYAAYTETTNDIYVDGEQVDSIYFPTTLEFTKRQAIEVWLESGTNTFEVRKNWGYFDIDAFEIEPAGPRDPVSVNPALVNPNASQNARDLMQFLADSYGSSTISGQFGSEYADWIEETTGSLPAILGFDMMDYSPSRVERGTTSTATEDAIAWYESGGIVQFQWHWNAPTGLIDEPGLEWYDGYDTDATTFDIAEAMATPGSDNYNLLIRDIDAIAVQLLKLQDAGVPVLWRPLHEAEGGWFWWGAKGSGPLQKLWELMYDRLTNYHGLNNLIWVWTSGDSPDSLGWYPGDNRVDIIGADIYPQQGSHPPSLGLYDRLVDMYGGRKMIAMSENGAMPDTAKMAEEGATWAWFMTWAEMVQDPDLNSEDFIISVYEDPGVITFEDLPDI